MSVLRCVSLAGSSSRYERKDIHIEGQPADCGSIRLKSQPEQEEGEKLSSEVSVESLLNHLPSEHP